METFSTVKYLVGTLPIPNTFPDLAIVQSHPQVKLNGGGDLESVLQITEKKPHWTIVRTVSLRDVIAVFTTAESNPEKMRSEWLDARNWATGDRISAISSPQAGIAYVSEMAPVIMTVEFGATAADSVEYVPPTGLAMACCCCCTPIKC
jgi:hypothetical protein